MPSDYDMPPAPKVLSETTAVEMTELYWMALLRDYGFDHFDTESIVQAAATELNDLFPFVSDDIGGDKLKTGADLPGKAGELATITPQNLFRLGLPGEDVGPLVSQFFLRKIDFGVQTIDQREVPYKSGKNYLTDYDSWLHAQNTGNGKDEKAYPQCNEVLRSYYEEDFRYIATMRDLARFVNKDALHQAYFNAALLLLNGGAKWTPGNPYRDMDATKDGNREAGFGTLGGPHILALVSEVATRALKIVWHQKWQVHLRLRPEAYGGLVHMEQIGADGEKRPYGLPDWVAKTDAALKVKEMNEATNDGVATYFLPMAFTAGSPAHPAYGAGHATVAGACVTVLKAYFETFKMEGSKATPVALSSLIEREHPYSKPTPFKAYITGVDTAGKGYRNAISSDGLTIEGELNKLAMNVAMGRTMGGVHWRTDNARSIMLGEAIAARILADITTDLNEEPVFTFRTFRRNADGEPSIVEIAKGEIKVDGVIVTNNPNPNAL